MQNADESTLQSILTKLEDKKLWSDDLVKKTTYKTDKNSQEFSIIRVLGKIPFTQIIQ